MMCCSRSLFAEFSKELLWAHFCEALKVDDKFEALPKLTKLGDLARVECSSNSSGTYCLRDKSAREMPDLHAPKSHSYLRFKMWVLTRLDEKLEALQSQMDELQMETKKMPASDVAGRVVLGLTIGTALCIETASRRFKEGAGKLCQGSVASATAQTFSGLKSLGVGVGIGAAAATSAVGATGLTIAERVDNYGCSKCCILRRPVLLPSTLDISVTNCLRQDVLVRASITEGSKQKPRSNEIQHSNVFFEVMLGSRSNTKIIWADTGLKLPQDQKKRVLLTMHFPRKFHNITLGFCKAKAGSSFLICEPDDDVRKLLFGCCPQGHLLQKSGCAGFL